MSTVGEDNLTALFDHERLVFDELLVQNVHQADAITEADDQV